jgi:hypothetical protein
LLSVDLQWLVSRKEISAFRRRNWRAQMADHLDASCRRCLKRAPIRALGAKESRLKAMEGPGSKIRLSKYADTWKRRYAGRVRHATCLTAL